jgi:hypothetical protein
MHFIEFLAGIFFWMVDGRLVRVRRRQSRREETEETHETLSSITD